MPPNDKECLTEALFVIFELLVRVDVGTLGCAIVVPRITTALGWLHSFTLEMPMAAATHSRRSSEVLLKLKANERALSSVRLPKPALVHCKLKLGT